MGQLNMENNKI